MAADHWAVVPAAGGGLRFGASLPKQYQPLAGRPVLAWTLDALLNHPRVAGAVVVLAARDATWQTLGYTHAKAVHTAVGGATRAASVLAGLVRLEGLMTPGDCVLVHDAARPLLHAQDLDRLLGVPLDAAGAALACAVVDTVRGADPAGRAGLLVSREHLWLMQTPQRFGWAALRQALRGALADGAELPDEVAAMQHAGLAPQLVPGRRDNFKITHPQDLALAAAVLAGRNQEPA